MSVRRWCRSGAAAVLSGLAIVASVDRASASLSGTAGPVAPTYATGTLAAPTGAAAARGSCTIVTSSAVVVTWTQSISTFADGYEILRSTTNGSGYVSQGTVAGRATTTFTDTTVAFLTTYYYVVRAKRNAWRSPNSNQASVTTPTVLCV
jgi:hypothetical protein